MMITQETAEPEPKADADADSEPKADADADSEADADADADIADLAARVARLVRRDEAGPLRIRTHAGVLICS